MDNEDEKCGRMDGIHRQLQSAYCQFSPDTSDSCEDDGSISREVDVHDTKKVEVEVCSKKLKTELHHPTLCVIPATKLQQVVTSVRTLAMLQSKTSSSTV